MTRNAGKSPPSKTSASPANLAASTACWAPMARVRPPRCACWPLSWSPPTEPRWYAAMTSSSTPKKCVPASDFSPPLPRFTRVLPPRKWSNILDVSMDSTNPLLKQRVDSIFSRLEMDFFRDRRCDKLSTGMKQKTSIARTLVHDPAVMIFDEPTARPRHYGRAHHREFYSRMPRSWQNCHSSPLI